MPIPPITPLTTRSRIEARIGQLAVDLRIDDNANSLNEIIADATVESSAYLSRMYSDEQLQSSAWVEMKVRDIAVYFLCMRRLNDAPMSAVTAYEKAIADLEKVQSGTMIVPDAATRKTAAPTLTNQRVRVRPTPNLVNVPHSSTGNPVGYPDNDDPSDYDPNP